VPTDHGIRLHNRQRLDGIWHQTIQPNKDQAIRVAVNAQWSSTTIATAAVGNLLGGDAMMRASRTPEIMGDAAYVILTKPSRDFTGQFCIDDKLLYASGVRDFDPYRVDASVPLASDFFVPDDDVPPPGVMVMPVR
jgi:citronellol/citronellal dehydrogenase